MPAHLRAHGDAPALADAGGSWTYRQLADAVSDAIDDLGPGRRLVLLVADHDPRHAVTYLACLAARHVAFVVPAGRDDLIEEWVLRYDPDTVVRRARIEHRHVSPKHDLHPELAALMTTSGSTGSPKLVRLSASGIEANARAIAECLAIRATDVAMLQLPLSYCYGLSILMSNLSAGAQVLMTSASVVDECFWDLAVHATSLSGVPYTFELLDRACFPLRSLPNLRYATVAGGRLDPDRASRLSDLGRQRGWELHLMYGQTEATARIAHLPPSMLPMAPDRIGYAIPGGELRVDGGTEGELVYTGPNVMLGYAESPRDLARGRDVHELHTGDIARCHSDGTFSIIGRRSRFAKIGGLRIDLDEAETRVCAATTSPVALLERNGQIVALCESDDLSNTRQALARATSLPASHVRVQHLDTLPRTGSGKLDYTALASVTVTTNTHNSSDESLLALFERVLGRAATLRDSFISLRGDSLSYVEMSVALEERLGSLPHDWHQLSIEALSTMGSARLNRPRRARRVETSVLLRAVSIIAVVGSHVGVFDIRGGAHLLLAIVGYNLGRFQLAQSSGRARGIATAAGCVLIPSIMWITIASVWTGDYDWRNVLLVHSWVSDDPESLGWRYWFVESYAFTVGLLALAFAIPALGRMDARWPFAAPIAVLISCIALRYCLGPIEPGSRAIYTPLMVLWCVALGWAIARATTTVQRVTVTGLAVLALPGFFATEARTAFVLAGVMLLIWIHHVPVPRLLVSSITGLAGSALIIYLTHWQLYPMLLPLGVWTAFTGSLVAGCALWMCVRRIRPSAIRALVEVMCQRTMWTVLECTEGLFGSRPRAQRHKDCDAQAAMTLVSPQSM